MLLEDLVGLNSNPSLTAKLWHASRIALTVSKSWPTMKGQAGRFVFVGRSGEESIDCWHVNKAWLGGFVRRGGGLSWKYVDGQFWSFKVSHGQIRSFWKHRGYIWSFPLFNNNRSRDFHFLRRAPKREVDWRSMLIVELSTERLRIHWGVDSSHSWHIS